MSGSTPLLVRRTLLAEALGGILLPLFDFITRCGHPRPELGRSLLPIPFVSNAGVPLVGTSDFIIDLDRLDFDAPIAGIEEIRKYNPQRFEMEQLTAILCECKETQACAAYKQLTVDEFWVRGHMPGMPLMPGVMILEAAAQLASYYTQKNDLLGAAMVGFGGLDDVRFRGVVTPGSKLIVLVRLDRVRRGRMIVAPFQGVVDGNLVAEGVLRGIPIPTEALNEQMSKS